MGRVAEWVAVFVLVGLSLFSPANNYSVAVGCQRAHQMVLQLPANPGVVLFSERSRSLVVPGVREVRCRYPEAGYRFRYDGLKLPPQSGDQYLLPPEMWSSSKGDHHPRPQERLPAHGAGPGIGERRGAKPRLLSAARSSRQAVTMKGLFSPACSRG
jgi:hypothetical protein